MKPEALLEAAQQAAKHAVCDQSGFPVGAALLVGDGRIFTGCNVESPSIIQVFCAERVALLKALSEGAREFLSLAIVTPNAPGASPCGLCRQMLFEFAPDLQIITAGDEKPVIRSIASYLPDGFRLESQ